LNFYFAEKKAPDYHSDSGFMGSGFTEPEVLGYHLVNILIHIGSAICLYFIFQITLSAKIMGQGFRYGNEAALLAALVWALHPVQTNAVTYIVQRMTSMSALFVLGSLLFYILGRIRQGGPAGKSAYFVLSLVFGLLAMVSKENSAMLPLLILGYEFYFLGGIRLSARNIRGLIILAAVVLMVIVIGWMYLGGNPFTEWLGGYNVRDFTLAERLLTQTRVVIHYLSLLVLPLPSRLNLAYDFPVSTSFFSPLPTFFAIVGIAALVLSLFITYRRDKLISFAIFWFLVNLVIESTVIPLEIIFEHRIYLPSAFAALALTLLVYRAPGSRKINLTRLGMLCIVVLLMIFTWQRNQTWSSRESVWGDVAAKAPNLTRGHMGLYTSYKAQNRNEEALEVLKKAVAVGPDQFKPSFNLANLYKEQKQYGQALDIVNAMLSKEHLRTAPVYNLRASIYQKLNNYTKAIEDANKALAIDPKYASSMLILGEAYFRLGNYVNAAKYYEKARESITDTYGIYFNLGTVYYNLGNYDKAIENYTRALDFMPGNADIHYNLGLLYGAKGMVKEMQEAMAKSKRLRGR
ncbi:MAG: tetratricopeptide repeat protein, partial [Desulfobulbales bacterium]|nr:tetratricopeptide repeat protein [Desulfobulbales bacterium]